MARPCDDCPFLKGTSILLSTKKKEGIWQSITEQDEPFNCHKTLDYTSGDGGKLTKHTKLCAGAAILLEKGGKLKDNWRYRLFCQDDVIRAVKGKDSVVDLDEWLDK